MLWKRPWDHCVLGTALRHKTSGFLRTLWRKCVVGTLLVKLHQDALVKKGGRQPKPLPRMHKQGVASLRPSFGRLCPALHIPFGHLTSERPHGCAGNYGGTSIVTVPGRGFD
jgi:hypothetical protein